MFVFLLDFRFLGSRDHDSLIFDPLAPNSVPDTKQALNSYFEIKKLLSNILLISTFSEEYGQG